MRWLLAPDSFKGCLSAAEVAGAMAEGLRLGDPDAEVRCFPMADGGEGTLAAIQAMRGGLDHPVSVTDATGSPRQVVCLFVSPGHALIEVARVAGLPDAGSTLVWQRHSQGVGELILACLDAGARRISVALGGSSTNDGGAGCLAALGARLLDGAGAVLNGSPDSLRALQAIDLTGLDPRLAGIELEVWSDVDNPLLGEQGATAVFGPQKGVAAEQVQELDGLLAAFATRVDAMLGTPCASLPGAGAAGGLGYVLQALGGRRCSGAREVARNGGLSEAMRWAERAITGEGRSDLQTLSGKVPFEVARLGREAAVPVSLLSGGIDAAALPALSEEFAGCFSLCNRPMALQQALEEARERLRDAAWQIARLAQSAR